MMRVFLYGTLRRGASNAHRMDGAQFVAEGVVAGCLIKIDWYPGLVLEPQGGTVRGEVWEVSAELLAKLDRYEGCDPGSGTGAEYRRVETSVRLDDGSEQRAWAWDWIGPTDGFPVIESGDWLG